MKNVLKLTISVLFLTIATTSFAQTFGVKAGLNLSNMLAKDDDDTYSDDFKMNPGFHIGPTVEFPINEIFSFESGLLLSTKGFRVSEEEGSYEYKQTLSLLYLDIPLTAKATAEIGDAKIYGTFGPYVGMGLSGKAKTEYTGDGETETDEDDISFGSDEEEDDLKGLDFGVVVGAGIEINSIQLGLSYGHGLANLSINAEDGYKLNNRVLKASVGYKFGKK